MLLDDFSNPKKRIISKRFVVYLNGKPATHHENLRDAEGDVYDVKQVLPDVKAEIRQEICYDEAISKSKSYVDESLDENLRKWFKEKWVRFGPDGKIRGQCARDDDGEGKPKCLPQAKAHALGKKGRASAASRKRREDPNPERSGAAINVATKKKTNEAGQERALEEGVNDNFLYHATQPAGIMRILRTGAIKASYRPQAVTKSRTQYPTVSTTRSKQYAESNEFVDFLNLPPEGNAVILVLDRTAIANHYKMFSTSQGTQTIGDEFEEVIIVPKGSMPIKGTLLGFYFNPKKMNEIKEYENIPWFKELFNSPYYLDQKQKIGNKQGVAESQKSKHNISEFGEPPMIGWFKVGDIISGKLRDGRSYTGEIEEITVRPSGKIKQLEMAKVKILTLKGEEIDYRPIVSVWTRDPDLKKLSNRNQKGVAEGNLKEFAPGDGSGEGRWYTDDQMIDIVGPDWAPEDDAGHLTLEQRRQDAQAWLDDQGYSVVVEDIEINPEGGYRWKIYGEFYNPRFAKKDQGMKEGLDDFHRRLGQQIRDRVARSQANLAIVKAKKPELWQWQPGDQVYSEKTGKTYTITGIALNQKNEPMYNYQRGEDENSENYERGRLFADLAHKTLTKINLEASTEISTNTTNIMNEEDDANIGKKAALLTGSPDAVRKARAIVQRQADQNIIAQARIAGAAPIEEDQVDQTVSIHDLQSLLNFSKEEKQFNNVKKLEQEIRSRQAAIKEGEVIHQRFGQGKTRSTFKKNPDINIPHYDAKRNSVYIDSHPQKGDPEEFADFLVEPSKYAKVFKIIGITGNGDRIQVSTTTSKDLADALVDAYLRGGYTDLDIERVELPKDNKLAVKKPNLRLIKTEESKCPECGGPIALLDKLNEKKDSCYYKVRSRYKVWPSAYASGALVQCRKKGAKNWGNKSESVNEDSPPTSATIDPNFHTAIRDIESRNNPNAVSRKGARGVMQVMPKTLRNPGYGVQPAKNNSPAELERVGKDYFNAMLDKYGGDKRMALIAYNMGPIATDKWASQGSDYNQLPKETQGYVPKVFNRYTELSQTNLPAPAVQSQQPVAPSGTTGTSTAPATPTSTQQTTQNVAADQNALLGRSVLPKMPATDKQTLEESKKHYFQIPDSLSNDDLREQFELRHDNQGWYLRESQQNFKKLYLNASKAFRAAEGFDLSKGNGSAPIKGDDVVTSPVGSIPKAQRKKNV